MSSVLGKALAGTVLVAAGLAILHSATRDMSRHEIEEAATSTIEDVAAASAEMASAGEDEIE